MHVLLYFYNEFYSLEDTGTLDPTNQIHKLALQVVYLPEIQSRLDRFQEAWNQHSLRTENHRTPTQLWTDGMLKNFEADNINNVFGEDPYREHNMDALLARHGIENFPAGIGDHFPAVVVEQPQINLSQDQQQSILNAIEGIEDLKVKYHTCCNEISNMLAEV